MRLNRMVVVVMMLGLHSASAQTFQAFLDRVLSVPDSERSAIVDSFLAAVPSFPFTESDTLAHFIYRGNQSSVTVPGDANDWDANAFPMTRVPGTDLWYFSRKFESDARLDYKFLLNGSTWILDPRNPRQVLGGYGPNSELRMPSYVPAPEIQYYPSIPHGTLHDTVYYSTNLGNSRTIRIYLPPGYEISNDSFPVILFHDGLEYVTLAQANNVLDYLISQRQISPTIAVFVPPVNRTAEYAGNLQNQFTSFIVNELMPYIDQNYRTQRNPSRRATLGASYGGNIALWLAYTHPEVFGNTAPQSSYIQSNLLTGFQSSPRLNLKLYLDLGTYDIASLIPLVRSFIPILRSKVYDYQYVEYHEGHSWGNWRAHIDNALRFFFPAERTGIEEQQRTPDDFQLLQNYPNPFNPTTTIKYQIPTSNSQLVSGISDLGFVSLKVFDVLGREVATLAEGFRSPGRYTVQWNTEASGSGVTHASGVYFARFTVTDEFGRMKFSKINKLALAK